MMMLMITFDTLHVNSYT